MAGSDFQLSDKPQVLFDAEGRIRAVNHLAAERLNIEPLTVLGRFADALPEGWRAKIGNRELPLSAMPRLWEAISVSPTLTGAIPYLRSAAQSQSRGRAFGLWMMARDGLRRVASVPDDLPEFMEPSSSLAIRVGRDDVYDGLVLSPVDGWPEGLSCRAWPLFLSGALAALVVFQWADDADAAWVEGLRIAITRFYSPVL